MISNIKITNAAKFASGSNSSKNIEELKCRMFKLGSSFAEKELEDLAVEFAEWILQHKNPSFGIISGYKSPNHWADTYMGGRIDYTTQELFEIFKKEKSISE